MVVLCACTSALALILTFFLSILGQGEIPWCFSQVKGTIEDEVADG